MCFIRQLIVKSFVEKRFKNLLQFTRRSDNIFVVTKNNNATKHKFKEVQQWQNAIFAERKSVSELKFPIPTDAPTAHLNPTCCASKQ